MGTPQVDWGWGKKFRAYDKATGRVIWEIELPSGTTGGPMACMSKGRQFIIVPIGGKIIRRARRVGLTGQQVRHSRGPLVPQGAS